jgi:hypothetical protein
MPQRRQQSQQSERPPRNRRGAPKGNLNALKHGFYSQAFRSQEAADLDTIPAGDLLDEIAMLRVAARRVFNLSQEEDNPDKLMDSLNGLGLASTRLAGLMRTQKLLGSQQDQAAKIAISNALQEIMEEFNIK